ncbi:DoxX family protein [Streptomyces sp. NPDC058008]|uniref:DoxX family protein n=1 Tax=Streptomyces sp. NPDC058008 TaxID=3346303 RepID=UPI0036EA96BC
MLLGALGLILPAWTGIAPVLTPTAAAGRAVIMALAIGTHIRHRESAAVVVNPLLLAGAVFVARGRFGRYSYRPPDRWPYLAGVPTPTTNRPSTRRQWAGGPVREGCPPTVVLLPPPV